MMRTLSIIAVAVLGAGLLGGCKSSSTVQPKAGEELTLEKPGKVTVAQGGMATVEVKISRKNISGPITVSFDKLPAGVEVIDADKKIVGDRGTYTLKAANSAGLVTGQEASVTVKSEAGAGVTEKFTIDVTEAKPKLEASLALEKPGKVTVAQGGTAKVEVKISRKNVSGPVTVSFDKLPAGVEAADTDQKIEGDKGSYTLKASDTAALVTGQEASVTVKGESGSPATAMFMIDVTEKK